jgi:solute carrier family 10 (sodium/bile acid cotransporter), member 7
MRSFLNKQWLLLGLIVAVILAFFFPDWGEAGGVLRSEITTKIGIVLIFFLQGWVLPTELLTKSMLHWRAHLFTQAFIFLIFPFVFIVGDLVWSPFMSDPLRTGFLFLAVLPTTISSAIVFTSQARGSTSVALFNTTVANVLGVFFSPLWMAVLVHTELNQIENVGTVLLNLSKLILLPLLVGQIAHAFFKGALNKIRPAIGHISQVVIVFIVFAAFSNSVVAGIWGKQAGHLLIMTTVLCILLFIFVTVLCLFLVRFLKFPEDDRIAILFCSTQKTLATGVPLGISLFGSDPSFGIILLPLIIFHPVQLILGAFLISRIKRSG